MSEALQRFVKYRTDCVEHCNTMTHDVVVPMDNANQSANILIVDDDQELGEMLKDFLAPDHLNVTTCLSGEDGLETLNTGKS